MSTRRDDKLKTEETDEELNPTTRRIPNRQQQVQVGDFSSHLFTINHSRVQHELLIDE